MDNLLNDFVEVKNYIIEIDENEIGTDKITIKLGTKNPSAELITNIKDHFRAKLRVAPELEFVSIAEINKLQFPKLSRKPMLFIDKRKPYVKK
jgi:phenylacetate-CoA ligase